MASSPTLFFHLLCFFLFIFCLCFPYVNANIVDYTTLVYKNCINQTMGDPGGTLSEMLSSLFQELVSQSRQSRFYEANAGNDETAISGLFQCRQDLSGADCYRCVTQLPRLSSALCGPTIPTRVQLAGCYIHYEAEESSESSSSHLELHHKTCSEAKAATSSGAGFEELRDAAFAALASGVVSGNGFCEMSYESMRVMAQCEGNIIESCDCGECVSYAGQIARAECGYSLSGQVFLDKCFLSYSCYPSGKPNNLYPEKEKKSGGISAKLVAIIVGGAAALFLGLVVFNLLKSWGKKRDDDW